MPSFLSLKPSSTINAMKGRLMTDRETINDGVRIIYDENKDV